MLFFKTEAKHNLKLGVGTPDEEYVSTIAGGYKIYNSLHEDAYRFICEINDTEVTAAFVVFGELNEENKSFPWEVGKIEICSEELSEITSEEFGVLMDLAATNGYMDNFRNLRKLRSRLKLFNYDYTGGMLANQEFYSEDVAYGNVDLEECVSRARDNLWNEALVEEFSRINATPENRKFFGHPVHYLFASDNFDEREKQAVSLIRLLYSKGRLKSRRFCSIYVSSVEPNEMHYLSLLYDCYAGGTVILRYRNAADDGSWGDQSAETVQRLASLVKRHANKVLTILCFPLACEAEKEAFFTKLNDLSVIEFNDDAVNYDRAKEYLISCAKKNDIEEEESLFDGIAQNKTYRANELNSMFDKWFSNMLRSKLYPEYSHCAKIGDQALKQVVKGDSYRELEEMVGLIKAKEVITKAINYYKAQKVFAEMGFEQSKPTMHMVFSGSPGTAKTTIARLFADIMRENGILSSGHLVEVGRADIVGKYVGSTAPLVKKAFRKAKGGVLFIDEAYSLSSESKGLYGEEAINTLVMEMENNRDTTCVILAGYGPEMEQFISSNPGLASRIAFNVPFEDYSTDELIEITKYMGKKRGITFSGDALKKLNVIYDSAKTAKDFGNGRFVRKTIDKARMSQAQRLIGLGYENVTKDMVSTVTAADIDDFVGKSNPTSKIGFAV